ncbi:2Fe-2S ferredoxin [beta proteobacterium AAP121]|nr:2Fe-2S ferredoxin [beta proteobacterium AAP65]KPF97142.1 2Fe-2S ferredoxin [beta proteobacterium AAP121]
MDAATPEAGLPLCASHTLEEKGRAFLWDVRQYGRNEVAFVMRFEGQLRAYLNRCVHVPTQMDWQPGEFLDIEKRYILCTLHGAAYEPHSGRCIGGPCGRGRLTPVAVAERDGQVYWYPSRDIVPVPPLPVPEPPAPGGSAAPAAPESPP